MHIALRLDNVASPQLAGFMDAAALTKKSPALLSRMSPAQYQDRAHDSRRRTERRRFLRCTRIHARRAGLQRVRCQQGSRGGYASALLSPQARAVDDHSVTSFA
jgi:hypothetical protein